jgi:hypothetical protein
LSAILALLCIVLYDLTNSFVGGGGQWRHLGGFEALEIVRKVRWVQGRERCIKPRVFCCKMVRVWWCRVQKRPSE